MRKNVSNGTLNCRFLNVVKNISIGSGGDLTIYPNEFNYEGIPHIMINRNSFIFNGSVQATDFIATNPSSKSMIQNNVIEQTMGG